MIGAIVGDVVGSRFEFHNHKTKEFDLFADNCEFTDDTVMTVAVAKALLQYDEITDLTAFKTTLIKVMHEIGRQYPNCGFGGGFYNWIMKNKTEPYGSYGNGSAMRVSPVAWYAGSLQETESLAQASAEITHNHPEGIKGAVSTAGCIYLSRTKASKEEIKEYIKKFYPHMDCTLDRLRRYYRHNETCQDSVPQAFECFLEANSFEDTIRNAISIGGDSDTIAAIAGSIAEAYYGIDEQIKNDALSFLDSDLKSITMSFMSKYGFTQQCGD